MTVGDIAWFAAEMATYVAVGVAGWRVHPTAGACVVLMMALWWGSLHSPRAAIHLPTRLDATLRIAWFGIGILCVTRVASA